MDLTQLELSALNILWQASGGNPEFKAAIENELQARIANNQNYSIEYLFNISMLQNHALGINLIPSSEAYNLYGPNITVSLILEGDQLEHIGRNYFAQPPVNSFGDIKVEVLVKDNLTPEQIENLKSEGINTSHILEIIHV
jgi:hypothetical protein